MIKEIVEGIKSLASSLSTKPLPTLGAILMLVIAYIGYRSYDTIQDMIITPEEEKLMFQKQVASSTQVMDAIRLLQSNMGAHSVVIKQFHNGKHDLTGLPFTNATPTFYTINYDIAKERPLSSYDKSVESIWGDDIENPKCVIIKTPVDNYTGVYMRAYDLERVVMCPLTNLLNYPIGLIVVGFQAKDTKVSDILALREVKSISERVSGYLQNEV